MSSVYEEEVKAKQKIILQLKKEIEDIHAKELIDDSSICWDNAALEGVDTVTFLLVLLLGINSDYRYVSDFLYDYDSDLGNSYQIESLLGCKACFMLNEYMDRSWYWNTIGRSEDGKAFNIILHKKGQQHDPSLIQKCIRIDEKGIHFQDECSYDRSQTASLSLPLKNITKEQFFQFTEWIKNHG